MTCVHTHNTQNTQLIYKHQHFSFSNLLPQQYLALFLIKSSMIYHRKEEKQKCNTFLEIEAVKK